MKYKLLISWYGEVHLENQVNEYLQNGWKLQGGVAMQPWDCDDGTLYVQAMVKPDKEETKCASTG